MSPSGLPPVDEQLRPAAVGKAAGPAELIFDQAALEAHKRRAARGDPSQVDFLLARAADDLAARVAAAARSFKVGAVIGALDGTLGRRLRQLGNIELLIEVESCPALLPYLQSVRVLADAEAVPFRPGSLELVASSLALHWLDDLPGTLAQLCRALAPDGLLLANLLAGQTLFELRESFLLAESETLGGASPRVAPFADVRALGALLQRAGLALPVADVDTVTVTYTDPLALMAELRAMGASNCLAARSRRPLQRSTLARAVEIYRQRFGRAGGRIPATFEIVTLTGFAPHESQQKPLKPGSARMRLADALGVEERPAGDQAGRGKAG